MALIAVAFNNSVTYGLLTSQKVVASYGSIFHSNGTLSRLHLEGNRTVNELGETLYLCGAYSPYFVWSNDIGNYPNYINHTLYANRMVELGVSWVKLYFSFRYIDPAEPAHRTNVYDVATKLTQRGIYVSFCFEPPEQDYPKYNYTGTGAHHDAKWKLIVDTYQGVNTAIFDWCEQIATDFKNNTGVWLIEPMTDVWVSNLALPYTYNGITVNSDEEGNVIWRVVFDECVRRIRAIYPQVCICTVNIGPDRMREPFKSNPYPEGSNIGYSIHAFASYNWDWYTYTQAQLENVLLDRFISFQQADHFVANTEFGVDQGHSGWDYEIKNEYNIYKKYGIPFQQHWFYGHATPTGPDLTYADGLTLSAAGQVWLEYGIGNKTL